MTEDDMSDDADRELVEILKDMATHVIEVGDHNFSEDTDLNSNFVSTKCDSNSNCFLMSTLDSAVYRTYSPASWTRENILIPCSKV